MKFSLRFLFICMQNASELEWGSLIKQIFQLLLAFMNAKCVSYTLRSGTGSGKGRKLCLSKISAWSLAFMGNILVFNGELFCHCQTRFTRTIMSRSAHRCLCHQETKTWLLLSVGRHIWLFTPLILFVYKQ